MLTTVAIPICCSDLADQIARGDDAFQYSPHTRAFRLQEGWRESRVLVACPWCGQKFPPALEGEWQERVARAQGSPHAPELLPPDLQESLWWEKSFPLGNIEQMSWPPDLVEAATSPVMASSLLALLEEVQSMTGKPAVPARYGSCRGRDYYFFDHEPRQEGRATVVVEFTGVDADGEPIRGRVVASETAVLRATWVRRDGGLCYPGESGQSLTPVRITHRADL